MTLNVAQKLNEEVHSAHCIRVSVAITQSYGKKIHIVRDPLIESGYSSYETYHSGMDVAIWKHFAYFANDNIVNNSNMKKKHKEIISNSKRDTWIPFRDLWHTSLTLLNNDARQKSLSPSLRIWLKLWTFVEHYAHTLKSTWNCLCFEFIFIFQFNVVMFGRL